MKSILYTLAAASSAALIILAPSVGWSGMGGSGGMMGGGSMMNSGQGTNRNTVQNPDGMIGTIDHFMNRLGRMLEQGNQQDRGNMSGYTGMNGRSVHARQQQDNVNRAQGGSRTLNR
jgi:hypothetical protein